MCPSPGHPTQRVPGVGEGTQGVPGESVSGMREESALNVLSPDRWAKGKGVRH